MSYLRYLCLFAYNGVQQILCCRLAYLMLPFSLNFPFFIASTVFSNVYFSWPVRYSLTFIFHGFCGIL